MKQIPGEGLPTPHHTHHHHGLVAKKSLDCDADSFSVLGTTGSEQRAFYFESVAELLGLRDVV